MSKSFRFNHRFEKSSGLGTGFNLDGVSGSGMFDVQAPVSGPTDGNFFVEQVVNSRDSAADRAVLQIARDMLYGHEYFRTYDETEGWSMWVPGGGMHGGVGGLKTWGLIQGVTNSGTALATGTAFTASGTGTAATIATTNLRTKTKRVNYAQAAADSKTNGLRLTTPHLLREEGFYARIMWGYASIAAAAARGFVGVAAGTAFLTADGATTEPSAGVNMFGVGFDAAVALSNQFSMHNDGTGTATAVDLGSTQVVAVDTIYSLEVWAKPGSSESMWLRLYNLKSGEVVIAEKTTNLPAEGTALGLQAYINHGENGPDAAATIDVVSMYFESNLINA